MKSEMGVVLSVEKSIFGCFPLLTRSQQYALFAGAHRFVIVRGQGGEGGDAGHLAQEKYQTECIGRMMKYSWMFVKLVDRVTYKEKLLIEIYLRL